MMKGASTAPGTGRNTVLGTTPLPNIVLVIPYAVCARHASHLSLFGIVQYSTVLSALDSAVDPLSALQYLAREFLETVASHDICSMHSKITSSETTRGT